MGSDSNEDNAHWLLDEVTVSCQCVLVSVLTGCHGDFVRSAGRSLLLLQTAHVCVSEVMWLVMAPPPRLSCRKHTQCSRCSAGTCYSLRTVYLIKNTLIMTMIINIFLIQHLFLCSVVRQKQCTHFFID